MTKSITISMFVYTLLNQNLRHPYTLAPYSYSDYSTLTLSWYPKPMQESRFS